LIDVRIGDVSLALPDRYRVLNRIAAGGMATVYRAEDGVLGREVAVKILAPHVAADPTSRKRFEREARTAARVGDHPNVVTIYDIGEVDQNAFIVMELYRGGTLADRLREGEPPVPRKQALAWLADAAAGLDYAHGRDVVHRDVKPANLLLDESGRLGVADFGIARLADESSLTQAGTVLGTAAYLSPEQALGEPATTASDRYSLAVVAFELLTGSRPFAAEHAAAQARQHVEATMPETGLGPHVDDCVCRMMAKEPGDRYPTCALFVEELEHAVQRAPSARTAAPTEPTQRAVAGVPVYQDEPEPPRPPDPTPRPRRLAPTPGPAEDEAAAGAAAAPPPPPRTSRAGRGGWIALAALGLVALVVAMFALLGGGDDGGDQRQASDDTPRTQPREPKRDREKPAAGTPAAPPADEEATPPAAEADEEKDAPDDEAEEGPGPAAGSESPEQLNDRGYSLLQSGDAASAIPLLERSVKGFDAQGGNANPTTFGYALFNLGQSYFAVGRYDDAITMYERRLQVSPNDRPGIVRARIAEAKARSGQG
jgi:serine/threonine-protein kinase